MKKYFLAILFTLLFFTTPNVVLADPDCWTKHMINQIADCSKAFLECNLPCGRIGNDNTRYSCLESCQKASKLCRDKAAADYRACVKGESPQTPTPATDPAINPQLKETSCEEIQKILKSKDCSSWVIDPEALQVYCSQNTDDLVYIDSEGRSIFAFRNRAADYAINQACFDELKQKGFVSGLDQQPQSSSSQDGGEDKSEPDLSDQPSGFLGINPIETWKNIWGLVKGIAAFSDVGDVGYLFLGMPEVVDLTDQTPGSIDTGDNSWNFLPGFFPSGDGKLKIETGSKNEDTEKNRGAMFKYSDLPKRTPEITDEITKQYRQEREEMMGSDKNEVSPYSVDILRGQAQIKFPNENEWRDIKVGEKIPNGSTIFTGMDTTTILTIEGVGVVEIAPFSEVKIDQPGIDQAKENKTIFTDIKLNKGEIEVNVEKGVFTAPILDVHTTNSTTSVRGTHFWVAYKNSQTVVGVYEGKVEVKTSNGNTQEVKAQSDQPGVLVISQKLSPVKLAIIGLVSVVIIGGVTIFLKIKFSKGISKRKR